MNEFVSHCGIMLGGVIIAGISQFVLKKAADKEYKGFIDQYVNWRVTLGYGLMVASTLCTVFAQRVIPLSMSPIWDACGQIFVLAISYFILREYISKRKFAGLCIMITGILIFLL